MSTDHSLSECLNSPSFVWIAPQSLSILASEQREDSRSNLTADAVNSDLVQGPCSRPPGQPLLLRFRSALARALFR